MATSTSLPSLPSQFVNVIPIVHDIVIGENVYRIPDAYRCFVRYPNKEERIETYENVEQTCKRLGMPSGTLTVSGAQYGLSSAEGYAFRYLDRTYWPGRSNWQAIHETILWKPEGIAAVLGQNAAPPPPPPPAAGEMTTVRLMLPFRDLSLMLGILGVFTVIVNLIVKG